METKTKYWRQPKDTNILTGFREDPQEDKRLSRETIYIPNIVLSTPINGGRRGRLS